MKYWILDNLVPLWFRTRWPMNRYYWQKEDLERAARRAKEITEALGRDQLPAENVPPEFEKVFQEHFSDLLEGEVK